MNLKEIGPQIRTLDMEYQEPQALYFTDTKTGQEVTIVVVNLVVYKDHQTIRMAIYPVTLDYALNTLWQGTWNIRFYSEDGLTQFTIDNAVFKDRAPARLIFNIDNLKLAQGNILFTPELKKVELTPEEKLRAYTEELVEDLGTEYEYFFFGDDEVQLDGNYTYEQVVLFGHLAEKIIQKQNELDLIGL